jgi:hypothetical protein
MAEDRGVEAKGEQKRVQEKRMSLPYSLERRVLSVCY